jgi:putative component of toxin-antitoxin plasmid stabilization module
MVLRPTTSVPKSRAYTLSQCEAFARWIEKLRDRSAAAVILRRLDRMKNARAP